DCAPLAIAAVDLEDAADEMPVDRSVKEHRRRHDQATLAVENHAAEIPRFADDGGIAGAIEVIMHLLDQARDLVAENLDGDSVPAHACGSRTRLRKPSTCPRHPGATTVVASNCSTMAGPAMTAPMPSRSRS